LNAQHNKSFQVGQITVGFASTSQNIANCYLPLKTALCVPRDPVMSANAGELFETMKYRLQMQNEGITNPPSSVKAATEVLVEKLASIDATESIEVSFGNGTKVKYIRSSTGEVLAEINEG